MRKRKGGEKKRQKKRELGKGGRVEKEKVRKREEFHGILGTGLGEKERGGGERERNGEKWDDKDKGMTKTKNGEKGRRKRDTWEDWR